MTLEDKFWAKVDQRGLMLSPYLGPCWKWANVPNSAGYSLFPITEGGKTRFPLAHRYAYELMIGPVPDGLELDHLCRNRACVNPAHLEAVTRRENLRRGAGLMARQMRQTHCIHGHEYNEQNTYFYGNRRVCAVCKRKKALIYYYRNKAKT